LDIGNAEDGGGGRRNKDSAVQKHDEVDHKFRMWWTTSGFGEYPERDIPRRFAITLTIHHLPDTIECDAQRG